MKEEQYRAESAEVKLPSRTLPQRVLPAGIAAAVLLFFIFSSASTPITVITQKTPEPVPPQPVRSGQQADAALEFPLKGVQWRFRWCPSGEFLMGSPKSEKNRGNNETQHKVTLTQGFWLGETAVTQEQWQSVMGDNPSNFKGAKLPVEQVSWDDCQKFVKKFNEKLKEAGALAPATPGTKAHASLNGFVASLPTEAQWEYACRAGTTTPFSFGSVLNGDKANCDGRRPYGTTRMGKFLEKTSAVGSYPANAWGLYDMHGNVWEWCSDWYGAYPTGSVTDPTGASSGSHRVSRGGSWYFFAGSCRSAFRFNGTPDYRDVYLGLRLCLVSESK